MKGVRPGFRDHRDRCAAGEALLRIECLGREVEMLISDNGRGFGQRLAEGAAPSGTGFGLTNMRQRVQILGGRLDIQSAPDAGVKIIIRLPIEPDTDES